MTTFKANIDSFPSSDVSFACRCDDTSHANDFSHTIALKITKLFWILA